MADGEDINSAFDSIVLSEDRVVSAGWEEGYRAGSREGGREGASLGRQRGDKVGQEIGFYLGFGEEWSEAYRDRPSDKKTDKISVALKKLLELVEAFPEENSKEDDFAVKLDQIRAKFKVLCSLLKINSEYGPTAASW